jgi:hypothetical protein
MPAATTSQATAPATAATEVGVSSDQPLFANHTSYTLTTLRNMAAAGRIALVIPGEVTPATDTPNGYKLIHPGYRRSD